MKSFIRNLSPRGEAILVILICFGLGIGALRIASHLSLNAPRYGHFNDHMLIGVVIYELLVLALVFLWIGRLRGWSFATFGFEISWKWTGVGLLLFALTVLVFILGQVIHPAAMTSGLKAGQITLPIIIINSITNGVFEEMMEVGYVFRAVQRYGVWAAILVSALIRAFLHVHLGIVGIAEVFVIGIIYGLVYKRWRQLWPLIVAHSLMDLIGLLYLAHHAA